MATQRRIPSRSAINAAHRFFKFFFSKFIGVCLESESSLERERERERESGRQRARQGLRLSELARRARSADVTPAAQGPPLAEATTVAIAATARSVCVDTLMRNPEKSLVVARLSLSLYFVESPSMESDTADTLSLSSGAFFE